MWKEIYGALMSCRRNAAKANPIEFLTFPVNGEPYITKNNVAIQPDWSSNHKIKDVLNGRGEFKKMEEYPLGRRPVHFEVAELMSTLWENPWGLLKRNRNRNAELPCVW